MRSSARNSRLRIVLAALALAAGGACSRPGGPDEFSGSKSEFPVPDSGVQTPVKIGAQTPPKCMPVQSSTPLPARTTIAGASQDAGTQSDVYLTSDLYNLFDKVCGGCHVESNLGNFHVTAGTFPTLVDSSVYAIITSDNPSTFMPPAAAGGEPFSQRQASDPVAQLASLLQLWIAAGSPPTDFTISSQSMGSSAGYAMTATLGSQLTNIGNCIPDKATVATGTSAMDQLDSFFASASTLPTTLDQTDLVSLDSQTLAQTGVISYAPTYPLWSDNAGKMRYVRVPRGQAIVFDRTKQTFAIPPNTRFYKTFLKQVVDANSNETYRKIETRLIVSRPDTVAADGSNQQNALYGTYLWNDNESQAQLLQDPLRDGQPFADRIFPYVTDEQKDQKIMASNPANLPAAESAAGITRHYAVPGSERCVQCHMGSPSASFVLGFTPLQVARRPTGAGGVYEPAMGDELTQLQRLIDYGVITGVSSPGDVLPLENAEGNRAPRNVYELNAQAYMVGNCAHCHNPRGFPSIRQPEIADVLIFLPGADENEGIFQFPIETMSPLRKRGLLQDVDVPYVTPSLYDYPDGTGSLKFFCPDQPSGSCEGSGETGQWILAPWRSLIYRNTDTPYDYFDDYALFPHMPLNTSGYDCRVAKLMGDWMVSIPAKVKNPSQLQTLLPIDGVFGPNANTDPQPYEEVLPGDSEYEAAVAGAAARLQAYHTTGFRYGFCPSTYTEDIVDPVIQSEVDLGVPIVPHLQPFSSPSNPNLLIMPELTPVSPDYISFDDTNPAGDWFPRRPDWESALVKPNIPTFIASETNSDQLTPDQVEDLTNVVTALQGVSLTDGVRAALTAKVPFGLWDTSVPGCNFTGVPTAGSFTGADRPQWMNLTSPPATAPVLVESAGASVFTSICYNCHGLLADSKGLLADEITDLTGGDARVADFRDGLFGPVDQPGANRDRVYGPDAATLGLTSEDLASRYMAWMALGGTQKHLPEDILLQVSLSPVIGQVRTHIAIQGTPDMLKLGLSLCQQIATSDPSISEFSLSKFINTGNLGWSDNTGLIDVNGDAELWLKLCNLGNQAIVRVPLIDGTWTATSTLTSLTVSGFSLYWGTGPNGEDSYGANPVMDQYGNVEQGITADNVFPLCVQKPTDPTQLGYATAALQASPVQGNVIPFCPPNVVQASNQLNVTSGGGTTDFVDGRKWAARGAINAALAVFLYLDQIESDPSSRQVLYNQCNMLGGSM
jgi:mono/diheme cytochrome c family protein